MGSPSLAMTRFLLSLAVLAISQIQTQAYRPLRPPTARRSFPRLDESLTGSPLYLTPYIESGDVAGGRSMARVDSTMLDGINEDIESYSGFLTVDKPHNGNMFFWFFPAEQNPESAPVVIWLQGGPGASSMFGLLKLHGPILTTVDANNHLTGVAKNPHSWGRKHNMIYIDNPVGAGFSFSNKLPTTQKDVTDNLYEFLQQWFTLFPMYQSNPFYPFGESYAGKFVPSITRRIHERNMKEDGSVRINLAGMGIGDGWMSPYHNARYADFLYQVGLVDERQRDYCLSLEENTQSYIRRGQMYEAFNSWNTEFSYFLNKMDCGYYYNIALCDFDPVEDNYEDFLNLQSTRKAIHVGSLPFPNEGDVYWSMINVFMESGIADIEYCLDAGFHTLIYDGNFDIICNHSGVLDMIADMEWKGKSSYDTASRKTYFYGHDVVGYLKQAENLDVLLVRNAGHMVPLSQPAYAQQMVEDFTGGRM